MDLRKNKNENKQDFLTIVLLSLLVSLSFTQPGHIIKQQGKYWEFYTPILRTLHQYSCKIIWMIIQCVIVNYIKLKLNIENGKHKV